MPFQCKNWKGILCLLRLIAEWNNLSWKATHESKKPASSKALNIIPFCPACRISSWSLTTHYDKNVDTEISYEESGSSFVPGHFILRPHKSSISLFATGCIFVVTAYPIQQLTKPCENCLLPLPFLPSPKLNNAFPGR